MPFVHHPGELFKLLKTQKIPATEVQVGDIVLDQQGNQVAHVAEVKRLEPPKEAPPDVVKTFTFVEFASEVATYDGYERSVTFRIDAEVNIIDRSCLSHLPGDAGEQQGGNE